jgi:cytochrome P450
MPLTRSRHWMGTARVLLRTRRARRAGDPGAVLRALTRGADTAVGLRVRGQRVLLLLDPAGAGELLAARAAVTTKTPSFSRVRSMLGDGLLTSEGEAHLRARRLVAPAFSPRRLAAYTAGFAERAEVHTSRWHDNEDLDMRQEMARLTLDMVGATLLGIDLRSDTDDVRAALESALDTFATSGPALALRGRQPAVPSNRPPPNRPPSGASPRAQLDAIVAKIVQDRRENPSQDRGDVVSALLAATAAPDGLTLAEVHDHVITLMMAGHETTANALSWTLYLLSAHPEVEQALHEELDRLGGRLPGDHDLAGLIYTRAVLTESMRLYPPAWIITRALTAESDVAGWRAPAGTIVAVSPLLLHHDARWFGDPERFDPARWLDERRHALPRYAYLPFGAGPRSCIGEQFAWAEATTALAVICSRWTARTRPGYQVRPQYRITMRPGPELPMRLRAR